MRPHAVDAEVNLVALRSRIGIGGLYAGVVEENVEAVLFG
jgi:hypothetical protein